MPSPSTHSLTTSTIKSNGISNGKLTSAIGPEAMADGVMQKHVKPEAALTSGPKAKAAAAAAAAVSPIGDHASNGIARINGRPFNGAGSTNGAPSAGPSSLRLETNGNGIKQGSADPEANVEGQGEQPARAMSEVARGKARQIDVDLQSVPREELEAEVRPETEGLVPMGAIVARLANYGYESFQNLADTLPSLPSNKRRARIFETALEVRKQMIKLLVLVRWSKCAPELQRARNLINLICDQYGQTEDAVNALTEARRQLAGAGMRNADLVTAIDVLGTGTSHRLPSSIKDSLVPPRPFTDVEAASLVEELNEAIRIRLACDEVLPAPLADYTIDDGRATFRVPGLFEAAVALGGDADEDRWWLMALTFDFQITGSGKDVFPRTPKKRTRMQLLAMADAELMPRSPAAAVEGATVEPITNTELPLTPLPEPGQESGDAALARAGSVSAEPNVRRDAPLSRLFTCLQRSALNYQLEILHFQALQLGRQNWGQSLAVRRDIGRRTLTIDYWRNKDGGGVAPAAGTGSSSAAKNAAAWDPTAGGSIRISVLSVKAREGAVNRTLARLLLGGAGSDAGRADAVNPQVEQLGATWECRAANVAGAGEKELDLSPHDLDVEKTLSDVVRQHASAALRACREAILRSPLSRRLSPHDCKVQRTATPDGSSEALLVPLHERARLTLRVDVFSGRLRLENDAAAGPVAVAALASSAAAARLREASRTVSREPSKLVEALQRLLVSTLIEDLERKLTYLGLACLRRMPLRQGDYATLDAAPTSLLYLPLVQCPAYYLVFHVGGVRPRVALVCAGAFIEGTTTVMGIQSVEWLDRDRIAAAASASLKRKRDGAAANEERSGFSAAELRRLHSYSVALVCYHKIEQQLRARGLPFVHISGARRSPISDAATKTPASPSEEGVSTLVPSLCVRSWPMLGPAHALVKPNLSICLRDWLDEDRCRVEIALKMRMNLGRFERTPPTKGIDHLDVYPESNILLFSTHSIDECIGRFQHCWSRVTKVAMLAREVVARSSSHRKRYPGLRLQTFDLGSVCFDFSEGLRAVVRWEEQVGSVKGGRYVVAFAWAADAGGAPQGKPPHDLLRAGLQRSLNLCDENAPAMWPAFIRYLYDVTPIVRICAPLARQALEDASCPEVEVPSATHLRLLFATGAQLDVSLLQGSKILLKASRQTSTALRPDIALRGAEEAPDAKQLAGMARKIVAALPKVENLAPTASDADGKSKAKPSAAAGGFIPRALALGNAIICDSAEQVAGKALQGFVDALGPKRAAEGTSDETAASHGQADEAGKGGHGEDAAAAPTKESEPLSSSALAAHADEPTAA